MCGWMHAWAPCSVINELSFVSLCCLCPARLRSDFMRSCIFGVKHHGVYLEGAGMAVVLSLFV